MSSDPAATGVCALPPPSIAIAPRIIGMGPSCTGCSVIDTILRNVNPAALA